MTASHWLSLDLSSSRGSLALHRQTAGQALELLIEQELGEGYHHTEHLIPSLSEALDKAHLTFTDLSRFITVSGPGSFTGLRIALSSLKAFAMVSQCPVDTLSGAEARAWAWLRGRDTVAPNSEISVLTHVATGRFVLSRFRVNSAQQIAGVEESVVTQWSAGGDGPQIVLTDGRVSSEQLPSLGPTDLFTVRLRAQDLAECLEIAGSRRSYGNLAEWIALSPEYFGAPHYS
jgi:tRNA threonylcarbamoyl adenosine modification protein YeaZ